jgi:dolichyl-diphosphooligosaccharide---protein glycosyltransferase subunit 1 (ribophorin I)
MIMKPRFPLMGGWKTQFNMGYNLPLYTCVGKAASGDFVLTLPFLVENSELAVDEALVRVVLPERADNIQVHAPFPVDGISYSTHVTYLDIIGRPVVEIRASKLTPEESMQVLQISYSFTPVSMLAEPLMVIGGFLVFFYAVIIVRRLDLSILPASTAVKND